MATDLDMALRTLHEAFLTHAAAVQRWRLVNRPTLPPAAARRYGERVSREVDEAARRYEAARLAYRAAERSVLSSAN